MPLYSRFYPHPGLVRGSLLALWLPLGQLRWVSWVHSRLSLDHFCNKTCFGPRKSFKNDGDNVWAYWDWKLAFGAFQIRIDLNVSIVTWKSKQAQNAAQVMLLQAINITVVLGQILLLFVATINLASTSFTLLSSFQTLRRRGRRSGHFHLSARSWQQRRSWTWHRASTTGQSHFPKFTFSRF